MDAQLFDAAKMDRSSLRKVYERGHALFLDYLEVVPTPDNFPLPYTLCDKIRKARWRRVQFANMMVSDDLSETINQLNAWCEWLMDLSVWVRVLDEVGEHDAWTIQHTYVDPLAHICLTQPSAVRDRFGYIATNAIHQANLNTVEGYKDRLEQDDGGRPLGRRKSERQLRNIGVHWKSFAIFDVSLQALDSPDYRSATWNYRNLAAHAIAPCFEVGITSFVKRGMMPLSEMVKQEDGSLRLVDHPTKKAVAYGFGGTAAIKLNDVYTLSLGEFKKSVDVFTSYAALIEEALAAMQSKNGTGN